MIFMVRKKGLAKAAGLTAVMLAAAVTITGVLMEKAVTTSADTDWGLSFQQEGQAPVTNVTPEFLARYDSWCMEDNAVWSLIHREA